MKPPLAYEMRARYVPKLVTDNPMADGDPFLLPYIEIIPSLLDEIQFAMKRVGEFLISRRSSSDPIPDLETILSEFSASVAGNNQVTRHLKEWAACSLNDHITHSFVIGDGGSYVDPLPNSRLVALMRLEVERISDRSVRRTKLASPAVLLPSPIKVLADFLTIPDEPASREYAATSIKAYLSHIFQQIAFEENQTYNPNWVTIVDIQDSIIKSSNGKKWKPNVQQHFIFFMLSMDGFVDFEFSNHQGIADNFPEFISSIALGGRSIVTYRRSIGVNALPTASEFANRILGLAVPMRGADTVFFGGLRFKQNRSLNMIVSGGPGTGKTSFGLFLASVLAPLGTTTFLITAEEAEDDLKARLQEVKPAFLSRTSLATRKPEEWFHVLNLQHTAHGEREEELDSILKRLATSAETARLRFEPEVHSQGEVPLPCPSLVILDGLQNFMVDQFGGGSGGGSGQSPTLNPASIDLPKFIQLCGNLGAFVVVSMAADQSILEPLEYLADLIVELKYEHRENIVEKPVRHFVLHKSRLQLSRTGTHVFHMSGDKSFRISPQLPSQLDRRTHLEALRPVKPQFIDIINRPFRGTEPGKDFYRNLMSTEFVASEGVGARLRVYKRSLTLVSGKGSTGKAGFGLSLVAAPIVRRPNRSAIETHWKSRVLIISFLYPKVYYQNIYKKIQRVLEWQHELPKSKDNNSIEVEYFYPGYMNPEDLYSRLSRRLDAGDLEGNPFTGLLIDGIHNTFLQFPRLQSNDMFWPMLYGMLRTRNLTVVTTHTTFAVHDGVSDKTLMRERDDRPLLHALVQATDFHFSLNRGTYDAIINVKGRDGVTKERVFKRTCIEIDVKSALGQNLNFDKVYWSREENVIWIYKREGRPPDLLTRLVEPDDNRSGRELIPDVELDDDDVEHNEVVEED
jgi:hypothetical protein